jgi:hypothetical protein
VLVRRGFSAKARDQLPLVLLSVSPIANVRRPGVKLGVQPPKLSIVAAGFLGHDAREMLGQDTSHGSCRIADPTICPLLSPYGWRAGQPTT